MCNMAFFHEKQRNITEMIDHVIKLKLLIKGLKVICDHFNRKLKLQLWRTRAVSSVFQSIN